MFKCKLRETTKLTESNYHQLRADMVDFLSAEEILLMLIEAEEYPEEVDNTELNAQNRRITKSAP